MTWLEIYKITNTRKFENVSDKLWKIQEDIKEARIYKILIPHYISFYPILFLSKFQRKKKKTLSTHLLNHQSAQSIQITKRKEDTPYIHNPLPLFMLNKHSPFCTKTDPQWRKERKREKNKKRKIKIKLRIPGRNLFIIEPSRYPEHFMGGGGSSSLGKTENEEGGRRGSSKSRRHPGIWDFHGGEEEGVSVVRDRGLKEVRNRESASSGAGIMGEGEGGRGSRKRRRIWRPPRRKACTGAKGEGHYWILSIPGVIKIRSEPRPPLLPPFLRG